MRALKSVLVTVKGARTLAQVKESRGSMLCNVHVRKLRLLYVKQTYENKYVC